MVVGAIQAGRRKAPDQPAKQRLVADVHAKRDLGLLTVAAKRALADQQADHYAALERSQWAHNRCFTALPVSPSIKT